MVSEALSVSPKRSAGCKLAADFGGDAMDPAMLFMVEVVPTDVAPPASSFNAI